MFAKVLRKFFTKGRDCDRSSTELHSVSPGADRMLAVAEPIPVEEQAKAVVGVPAEGLPLRGILSVRAGGLIAGSPGLFRGGAGIKDNVNLLGLTHPAGNHSYTALKRARLRVPKPHTRWRNDRPTATPDVPLNHEVLERLLPGEGDILAFSRKIFNDKLSAYVFLEFFPEGGDCEDRATKLLPVSPGTDHMLAIAEPIPVEQEPKAVVGVPAEHFSLRRIRRVWAGGLIAGSPGLFLSGAGIKDNINLLGLAHPAGNYPHTTLKRARLRVLKR